MLVHQSEHFHTDVQSCLLAIGLLKTHFSAYWGVRKTSFEVEKKCRGEKGNRDIWKHKGLTVNCEDMEDEKAAISLGRRDMHSERENK